MENMQKDSETISLKKIIVDYLYHWKVFLVAACISLVCAILYMVIYPQTYEFVARIKIQEDKNLGRGCRINEIVWTGKYFGGSCQYR